MFKSVRDLTSSRTAFRNRNQVTNLGLKIESDFRINSFAEIKIGPDCLTCLFSVFLRNESLVSSEFLHQCR